MKSGPWRFLMYLVLPQPAKMALLPDELRGQLDRINLAANVGMYSGPGATAYDATHRYAEADHHEYPAQQLVEEAWAGRGYGRALELGAGSGYFTRLIASRAESVVAVEPVPDMQRVLRERCKTYGTTNIEILAASAAELPDRLAPHSVDSAFVIQSLHHMLQELARHNLERARGFLNRRGFVAVVLARWLPWVRTLAPLGAGVISIWSVKLRKR